MKSLYCFFNYFFITKFVEYWKVASVGRHFIMFQLVFRFVILF